MINFLIELVLFIYNIICLICKSIHIFIFIIFFTNRLFFGLNEKTTGEEKARDKKRQLSRWRCLCIWFSMQQQQWQQHHERGLPQQHRNKNSKKAATKTTTTKNAIQDLSFKALAKSNNKMLVNVSWRRFILLLLLLYFLLLVARSVPVYICCNISKTLNTFFEPALVMFALVVVASIRSIDIYPKRLFICDSCCCCRMLYLYWYLFYV